MDNVDFGSWTSSGKTRHVGAENWKIRCGGGVAVRRCSQKCCGAIRCYCFDRNVMDRNVSTCIWVDADLVNCLQANEMISTAWPELEKRAAGILCDGPPKASKFCSLSCPTTPTGLFKQLHIRYIYFKSYCANTTLAIICACTCPGNEFPRNVKNRGPSLFCFFHKIYDNLISSLWCHTRGTDTSYGLLTSYNQPVIQSSDGPLSCYFQTCERCNKSFVFAGI